MSEMSKEGAMKVVVYKIEEEVDFPLSTPRWRICRKVFNDRGVMLADGFALPTYEGRDPLEVFRKYAENCIPHATVILGGEEDE
jgi:hypothetical protein